MYSSISSVELLLLALLHCSESVHAGSGRLSRRQSSTPVALWDPCNYPSQGINGPLPCATGSECICKDDTYAQCREQLDGSWAPDPSWQCQQPGETATGGSSPSPSPTGGTSSGTDDTTTDNTGSGTGDTTTDNTGSGTNDTTSNLGSDTLDTTLEKSGSGTGGTKSKTNSGLGDMATDNTGSGLGGMDTDNTTSGTGDTTSPNTGSQAATIGGCNSVSSSGGWDGLASTSYYGWMGSSCDCGQNSWEWADGGAGVYNAAVNQKIFNGALNSGGAPNCGSACGTCYELSTTGFNAYNGGVGSGSTITVQIIDACYGAGDHWCGSTSSDYKDSSQCSVHFDIQTGAPGTNGQAAVGADGTTWNDGGQIVYYRSTSCPQTLASGYKSSCTC